VIHSIEPETQVLERFGTCRYCTKFDANWPNWCYERTSSLNKVASEFFATNAPDPLHWTQNSCFGAFRTILILHESRCKTGRTGAIIAQVWKTKSRRNFSQPTHPIESIWQKTPVLGRFGPFCYCTKVDAKLDEQVPLRHKFAKGSCFEIFRNERTWSTPWDPKLIFWTVSGLLIGLWKLM
jgi:hypothetical protein